MQCYIASKLYDINNFTYYTIAINIINIICEDYITQLNILIQMMNIINVMYPMFCVVNIV